MTRWRQEEGGDEGREGGVGVREVGEEDRLGAKEREVKTGKGVERGE